MRWEGLFGDLEGQLAAGERRELDDEVAERTRRERALVPLPARLAAALGSHVGLTLRGGHRLRGELLCRDRGPDDAEVEHTLDQALDAARRQGARSLELRPAMDLARLWRDQSRRIQAYNLLAPIYDWFTEGFDTADLKDGKALLDELA